MPASNTARNLAARAAAEWQRFQTRVFGGQTVAASAEAISQEASRRVVEYDLRDQLLSGAAYNTAADGGSRAAVLRGLGKPYSPEGSYPLFPYFNPFGAIVAAYQHTLAGAFGRELEPVKPGKASGTSGDPLDTAVADALAKVWRWSNLDSAKNEIIELAANQGTVGLRVVYQPGDTPAGDRVYVQYDHPKAIQDIDFDARGNVTGVLLERTLNYSTALGRPETQVTERTELTRSSSVYALSAGTAGVGGFGPLPESGSEVVRVENPLGVCPYVLMRHDRRPGDTFGRHAYAGSERPIHGINWMLSQLDEAAARAISETIFMSGSGPEPAEYRLGRVTAIYARTAQGVPPPSYERITPALDFTGVLSAVAADADYLLLRQPELALNNLRLLSGISGETLSQVLKPAESAVLRARALYEDGLIRALQIALSYGVLFGLWNLGTGTGSADAADAAYDDGQGPMAFRFKARPSLPLTPAARLADTQAQEAELALKWEKDPASMPAELRPVPQPPSQPSPERGRQAAQQAGEQAA